MQIIQIKRITNAVYSDTDRYLQTAIYGVFVKKNRKRKSLRCATAGGLAHLQSEAN